MFFNLFKSKKDNKNNNEGKYRIKQYTFADGKFCYEIEVCQLNFITNRFQWVFVIKAITLDEAQELFKIYVDVYNRQQAKRLIAEEVIMTQE